MTNLDKEKQTFLTNTLNKTMEKRTKMSDQTIEAVEEAEEEEDEENSGEGETIIEGDEEILRTGQESSESLKRE